VAANAHIWKIQAFDVRAVEIPSSMSTSRDQIVSLLAYIADAELQTCQQVPAIGNEWGDQSEEEDEEEDTEEEEEEGEKREAPLERPHCSASTSAAAGNAMKPLKHIALTISIPSYSPVFPPSPASTILAHDSMQPLLVLRLVLTRLERILESSFAENLAVSGLVSALAQKRQCATLVFDTRSELASGQSVRSVLEDVHADAMRRIGRLAHGEMRLAEMRRQLEQDEEATLNDHDAEVRLLCGFVIVEEMLKELCSILFARERVTSLPVKPEGYYLEPKRALSIQKEDVSEPPRGVAAAPSSIGQEFEQLMAEAASQMGSLLSTTASC
jgi:hypothetical protein